VLAASAVAAIGVLAALAPRAYDAARREVLIARLEKGDDPEARRELADPRHAARLHARLRDSGNARLVGPLIDLAAERKLDPVIRAEVFDRFLRPDFTDGSGTRTINVVMGAGSIFPEGCKVFVSMARSGTTEFVDLGEWTGRSYTVPRQSSNGDVVQFMEWFVIGEGRDARLVHQRSTWVIIPPGPGGTPFRIETEDMTDSKDPQGFLLGRPVFAQSVDGVPGTFLRFGFFGSWRQFFPGQASLQQAFSYAIYLDLQGQAEGPHLLGWIEAGPRRTSSQWGRRWRSAFDRDPEGLLGTFVGFVPETTARLEPFQKLKLLFRPAPEFAAEHGISAPEVDSPPFEREMYLTPAER
jgi:hypothetical protein